MLSTPFAKWTRLFSSRTYQLYRAAKPLAIRALTVESPRIIRPLFMTTGLFLHSGFTVFPKCHQEEIVNTLNRKRADAKNSKLYEFFRSIGQFLMSIFRFFHLILIFSPAIVTMPLRMFDRTKDLWIDIFVNCVARAGVVWIKAFQYLSHRRDMIGEDMANKFVKLRDFAPQHSFKETEISFKRQFGKTIDEIFDSFDKSPIASGSVSQVYQAVYKGQKVAVKVRHPKVEINIERDLDILFGFSRFMSIFSGRFDIPVGQQSLKKTLVDQIDFNIEARNLRIFNKMFENSEKVKFPVAIEDTSSSGVLVESFVQGLPVTYYEQNHHKLNKVIARIGATTFFQMLMKNNFIHADCHGGNIMVKIKERSTGFMQNMEDLFRKFFNFIQKKIVTWTFSSKLFKDLYLESKRQEEEATRLEKQLNKDVEVTLIDVGMVIELDETDRKNFVNFIKSFIMQEPEECAQMIYSLSLHKGKKIVNENFQKYREYYQDLKELFSQIKVTSLKKIDGTKLFRNMLDLIRESKMKLDGQFATLLTNMLVLEAIAKDLNPEINILKCAVPYFQAN